MTTTKGTTLPPFKTEVGPLWYFMVDGRLHGPLIDETQACAAYRAATIAGTVREACANHTLGDDDTCTKCGDNFTVRLALKSAGLL